MIYRHNSTIGIKKKPCKSCGRDSIIFSQGRCQNCSKIEDTHAKIAASQEEEDGLPELIDRLDGLISKWVRFSAPRNSEYLIECFTCSDWRMPSVMDAGHYITRNCMYLRFDVARNLRPQCHICNRSKYGMAVDFGKRLELEMPGVTEILLEESRIVYKWSREELRVLINEFTQKVKRLK